MIADEVFGMDPGLFRVLDSCCEFVAHLGLRDTANLATTCQHCRELTLAFFISKECIDFSRRLTRDARWPVSDAFVQRVLLYANSLLCVTTINLTQCWKITDDSIKAVAAHCPILTDLNVQGCGRLTDDAIKTIAMSCSLLTSLNLTECWITDDAIQAIGASCPLLMALNVTL